MSREEIVHWAIAVAIVAGAWVLGLLVRHLGLGLLARMSRHTKSDLEELVIGAMRHSATWPVRNGRSRKAAQLA